LYSKRGHFYVRLPVPRDLRGVISSGEHIIKWLGTDSLARAKEIAPQAIKIIKESFARVRLRSPADAADLQRLHAEELHRAFKALAAAPVSRLAPLAGEIADLQYPSGAGWFSDLETGNPLLNGVSTQAYVAGVLREKGIDLEPSPEVIDAFRQALLSAQEAAIKAVRSGQGADTLPAIPAPRGSGAALTDGLDEWLTTLKIERKSAGIRRTNILRFAETFPTVASVNRPAVQRWVEGLLAKGLAPSSVQRIKGDCRVYWARLERMGIAPDHVRPFDNLDIPASRKGNGDKRKAFTAAEVSAIMAAAAEGKDKTLADLIQVAAYTGARREEIAALKIENVNLASGVISIVDAKSEAGVREVPLHSALTATMRRLVNGSTDGYVLPGLTADSNGDRGSNIGKHFGRLKARLGFGPNHVFHSLRKTVATLLENASVLENVTADILGHEKPRITYGLYSEGASLAVKREAIERISYPMQAQDSQAQAGA
ncbi:MAG: tyrosine-type recombinase/integrase, partial [Alphaproteobacteria bacterium]